MVSVDGTGRPGYMNRLQMAARLGVSPHKLRGYTNGNEVYFGGVRGKKGYEYPETSEPLFREALEITPVDLRAKVRRETEKARGSASASPGSSTADLFPPPPPRTPPPHNTALSSGAVQEVAAAIREMAAAVSDIAEQMAAMPPPPPPEDRLLSAKEAARLLKCRPRSVTRYVTPFRGKVYRRSDIYRYIATDQPQV